LYTYYGINCIERWIGDDLNEEMKPTPRCPRCFAQLVLKMSRRTTYFGCPNYPDCKRPVDCPKAPQRESQVCRAA
jgi:ssDNA-binding Zn-finger/Zn-ribbon topoisomerase 1